MVSVFYEVCDYVAWESCQQAALTPRAGIRVECLETGRAPRPAHEAYEQVLPIMDQAVHLVVQRRWGLLDGALAEVE